MIKYAQKMREAEGAREEVMSDGLIGATLEYVNVNLTEDISVQDIADALNISRLLS